MVDEFEGWAPGTGTYTAAHEQFFRLLTRLTRQMEDALDTGAFSPSQAVHILSEIVHAAVRFGVSQSYLAGIDERRDERRTAVALELAAARSLATMASPVLPDLASRLWDALGFEGDEGPGRWESAVTFLPAGQDVEGLRNLTWPALITNEEAGPAR